MFGVCRALGDDGPHHFMAGRVAQGMNDAAMAMATFARQGELAVLLVEIRPKADQIVDLLGRLADDLFDNFRIAQAGAGDDGVFDVTLEIIFGG